MYIGVLLQELQASQILRQKVFFLRERVCSIFILGMLKF